MKFKAAQENMRNAYFGGGPGVFASGVVWLITAAVALLISIKASVLTLFIGGMFIHPLGILLSKLLKCSGKHEPENPLGGLAIESTFILFIGLFIAYNVLPFNQNWFFPIMLMIIGGRYLVFSTIYGMRIYWVLGALLVFAGGLFLNFNTSVFIVTLTGGVIEVICSILIVYLIRMK